MPEGDFTGHDDDDDVFDNHPTNTIIDRPSSQNNGVCVPGVLTGYHKLYIRLVPPGRLPAEGLLVCDRRRHVQSHCDSHQSAVDERHMSMYARVNTPLRLAGDV